MGGLESSTTVAIYEQTHEETTISKALHSPNVCKQLVDEVDKENATLK